MNNLTHQLNSPAPAIRQAAQILLEIDPSQRDLIIKEATWRLFTHNPDNLGFVQILQQTAKLDHSSFLNPSVRSQLGIF